MKKLLLLSVFAIFTIGGIHAQGNFEASIDVGLVTGDASDYTSFSAGASLAYLIQVSDNFRAGPQIGYTNFFGKSFNSNGTTIKTDDFGVIPILAKGQYSLSDKLGIEAGAG